MDHLKFLYVLLNLFYRTVMKLILKILSKNCTEFEAFQDLSLATCCSNDAIKQLKLVD